MRKTNQTLLFCFKDAPEIFIPNSVTIKPARGIASLIRMNLNSIKVLHINILLY